MQEQDGHTIQRISRRTIIKGLAGLTLALMSTLNTLDMQYLHIIPIEKLRYCLVQLLWNVILQILQRIIHLQPSFTLPKVWRPVVIPIR